MLPSRRPNALIVCFGLVLAPACVVEDVPDPETMGVPHERVASGVGPGRANLGGDPEACGCDSHADYPPVNPWDVIFECEPGETYNGRGVQESNCHEVMAPDCDAQIGCTMVDISCTCEVYQIEIGVIGGSRWNCVETGNITIEECTAQEFPDV